MVARNRKQCRLDKLLNEMAEEIENTIADVNYGGCCVVAALVGQKLDEMGVYFRVLVADDYMTMPIPIARNRVCDNKVSSWNDAGVGFGHVFLEIEIGEELVHFDTESGICAANDIDPSFGYDVIYGHLSLEESIELAMDSSGWNPTFDRRNIPVLTDIVNKYLAA